MRKSVLATALFFLTSVAAFAANKPVATWVGTWATSPEGHVVDPGQPSPANATYRDIVHTSLGGREYRVTISNEFGTEPLKVGAVHAAISAGDGAIQAGTDHAVTFGGSASVTVPVGAMMVSDPIDAPLPAESNLAISIYLPQQFIQNITYHRFAGSTNYIFHGNAVSDTNAQGAWKIYSWGFLKGVDVLPDHPRKAAAIVTLGDSITDGVDSTRDANRRWPDVLARRLLENPSTSNRGVLNEGMGGNCILNRCAGQNALRRFDRDVLAQSGVKYLIIFEGVNDIGAAGHPRYPERDISANDLIVGMKQLIQRAHEHGIKVVGATITPFQGSGYYSAHGEQMHEAVNHWIRASGEFDGVIDFDQATRDPNNPNTYSSAVDSPDHLHPGDAGYKIMGDSINLGFFH